jgi:hypothetical protein
MLQAPWRGFEDSWRRKNVNRCSLFYRCDSSANWVLLEISNPEFANCGSLQRAACKELWIILRMTDKMQRCIMLFIIVNVLHVSSGFSAHHQELKYVHAASGICQTSSSGAQIFTCSIRYLSNLFAVTFSVNELGLICVSNNTGKPVPTHPR